MGNLIRVAREAVESGIQQCYVVQGNAEGRTDQRFKRVVVWLQLLFATLGVKIRREGEDQ